MGVYFSANNLTEFDQLFIDKTIEAILEFKYVRKFYKIDNFRKLYDFFKYANNHPYTIRNNCIHLGFSSVGYKLDDKISFVKLIKKIRENLIEQNYSDEEFAYMIDNTNSSKEKYVIDYQEKLDKINFFFKITNEYTENHINLKGLQNKNIPNVRINNHLEKILKGTISKYSFDQQQNLKFGLIFIFNDKIFEYEVDTFVLNSDYFNVLITGENFIKNKKVTLNIDDENTGKDFIIYLYTNKLRFKLSIENINRIQSLKTLANFCFIEDLYQLCDDIIRCIQD